MRDARALNLLSYVITPELKRMRSRVGEPRVIEQACDWRSIGRIDLQHLPQEVDELFRILLRVEHPSSRLFWEQVVEAPRPGAVGIPCCRFCSTSADEIDEGSVTNRRA